MKPPVTEQLDKIFAGGKGSIIKIICDIKDPLDMGLFFDRYVALLKHQGNTANAEGMAKANIGWCFGYGMDEQRMKLWNSITGATHPVFGVTKPTPEEAMQAGMKLGEQLRAKKEGTK